MTDEPTLKNRPKRGMRRTVDDAWFYDSDKVEEWFEDFEKKLRDMDFAKWFEENQEAIMQRWNLTSHCMRAELTPSEVLQFFVEKEVLGQ